MRFLNTLPLLALIACAGGDDTADAKDADTRAAGNTTYRDAETQPDGAGRSPMSPGPQPEDDPMWVEIAFEGTGDLSLSDPSCDLTDLGGFEGLYMGEATIDEDGAYVASFTEAEAEVMTPSGCEIPELSVELITDVVVRGYLSATQENCDTYCAAYARAEAEEQCAGDSDEVSCRAEAEASYTASCDTTCTGSTTYAIVAETSLGASAISDIALGELSGAALGTISADLTFDHIEDSDGNEVDTAP